MLTVISPLKSKITMNKQYLLISLMLLFFATTLSFGASEKIAQLNQAKIHWEYSEGNFETVIELLEGFRKSKSSCNQADSIFLNKHLGVVYASNPNTREKGKYYFFKMLEVSSTADLSDMFVSDDIDKLFTKVKLENVSRSKTPKMDSSALVAAPWKKVELTKKENLDSTQSHPNNLMVKTSTPPPPHKSNKSQPIQKFEESSSHIWLWTALGGSALIATGSYFYLVNQTDPKTTTYTVPQSVNGH